MANAAVPIPPKAGCVFCLKKPVEFGDKAVKAAFMCFQPGVRTLTRPPGGGCISHWLTGGKRTRNAAPECLHRDLMTVYSPMTYGIVESCTASRHRPIKTESIVRHGISRNWVLFDWKFCFFRRSRGVRKVTYGWFHALVTLQECSAQIKMFRFFVKNWQTMRLVTYPQNSDPSSLQTPSVHQVICCFASSVNQMLLETCKYTRIYCLHICSHFSPHHIQCWVYDAVKRS